MSRTPETKLYHVNLAFGLEDGVVHWVTEVDAEDEDGAVNAAVTSFWSQMDYRGAKPLPKVTDIHVVTPEHVDPMARETHAGDEE
jgi:hypothetical protein